MEFRSKSLNSLESLHNSFGITVKSRKTDEKIGFFDFWL